MAYEVGFTPFARDKLLLMTDDGGGFAKDSKVRTFVMKGQDADGKSIRRELCATTHTVFIDYAGRYGFTRLWVDWKGSRRLVHRKE